MDHSQERAAGYLYMSHYPVRGSLVVSKCVSFPLCHGQSAIKNVTIKKTPQNFSDSTVVDYFAWMQTRRLGVE